jgi:hypothetical protein
MRFSLRSRSPIRTAIYRSMAPDIVSGVGAIVVESAACLPCAIR